MQSQSTMLGQKRSRTADFIEVVQDKEQGKSFSEEPSLKRIKASESNPESPKSNS